MRAIVIYSNQKYASTFCPFPPIGTKGTVVEDVDEYGEYEIVFDNYPTPTVLDVAWTVHKSMVVFIEDDDEITQSSFRCKQNQL